VKNQWHSYGISDKKFKTEIEYINAFKNFIKTGLLPILVLIFLTFSCKQNSKSDFDDNKNIQNDSLVHSIKLKEAINRIYKFNDGIGSNFDVLENYKKEKKTWLKEIDMIYNKLCEKVQKEKPNNLNSLILFHKKWLEYTQSKREFKVNYIQEFYTSGEYIFQIIPDFRNEYKSKLIEYYNLYEIEE
jgi:hypothetical protein